MLLRLALLPPGRVRDKAQPGLRGAGGQCDGWATRLHERTRLRQFKPGVCCRLCVGSERGQNDGLPRAAGAPVRSFVPDSSRFKHPSGSHPCMCLSFRLC
eukprot:1159892-Pelagomonas_calceolata.AAC.22